MKKYNEGKREKSTKRRVLAGTKERLIKLTKTKEIEAILTLAARVRRSPDSPTQTLRINFSKKSSFMGLTFSSAWVSLRENYTNKVNQRQNTNSHILERGNANMK